MPPQSMDGATKRVLFIAHEATRTGAAFVLYDLLKWLRNNSRIQPIVLLAKGGDLERDFLQISEVYRFDPTFGTCRNRLVSFIYRRLIQPIVYKIHRRELLKELKKKRIDLIYSNTVANGRILEFLEPLQCKVISHIHELQYVIDGFGFQNALNVAKYSTHYIAVANEVKQAIVEKLNTSENVISVLPELIDFDRIDKAIAQSREVNIRGELGVPPQSFVVGCAGSVEWRKGADLFVQVAVEVLRSYPNAFFVWVGGEREDGLKQKLEYDVEKAGFAKRIKFVGSRSCPYAYFSSFDIFLLTSREDPYPLVNIENLYLNKPVVCFRGSGGAPGLIRKYDLGAEVPYINTKEMAQAILGVVNGNVSYKAIDGASLREEHSVSTVGPKVLELIYRLTEHDD